MTHDEETHSTACAFEVDLPLTGANADTHQVVFHFTQVPTFRSASVTPAAGKTATVSSASVSGTEILVNLANVTNAQTLTVNMVGVNAGARPTSPSR